MTLVVHKPISKVLTIATLTLFLFASLPGGSAGPSPLGDDDDAGSGTDAGDRQFEALPIEAGSYTGRLTAPVDRIDWYAFNVTNGQGIRVAGTYDAVSAVYFDLRGPNGEWVYTNGGNPLHVLADQEGTWYLVVNSGYAIADYGFEIQLVDLPPQDDAGSGKDASRQDRVPLPDGESTGTLNAFDTNDQYTFEVVGTQTISIRLTTEIPEHLWLSLWDEACCNGEWGSGKGDLLVQGTFTDTTVTVEVALDHWRYAEATGGNYTLDLTRSVPAGAADLVVKQITEHRAPITTDFGSVPNNVNERRMIEIEIANEGEEAAGRFTAGFATARGHQEDAGRYSWPSYQKSVEGLAPGETVTVQFTWDTTLQAGDYTLIGSADFFGSVSESDEENNLAQKFTYVRVGGLV